jgi:ABC-type glycerol-3-phosphate transport system substrate-binding protein
MTTRHHRRRTAVVRATAIALSAGVVLSGCGSDSDEATPTTEPTPTSEANETTVPAGTGSEDTTSSTAPSTEQPATVNANTATVAEMTEAFTAAGVPNAAQWAREVEEYRPYTDDGWAHLYDELSKYDIDDDTFERITGALTL